MTDPRIKMTRPKHGIPVVEDPQSYVNAVRILETTLGHPKASAFIIGSCLGVSDSAVHRWLTSDTPSFSERSAKRINSALDQLRQVAAQPSLNERFFASRPPIPRHRKAMAEGRLVECLKAELYSSKEVAEKSIVVSSASAPTADVPPPPSGLPPPNVLEEASLHEISGVIVYIEQSVAHMGRSITYLGKLKENLLTIRKERLRKDRARRANKNGERKAEIRREIASLRMQVESGGLAFDKIQEVTEQWEKLNREYRALEGGQK